MSSAVDPKLEATASAGVETERNSGLFSSAVELEPDAPSDAELMLGIQAEEPEALSQLYDRYSGILKALILRVIHNDAEADDLLQEVFMEIWNQAKNFSARKAEDFIIECYALHETFALSLRPAKSSAASKERLMSMVREKRAK